MQQGWEDEVCLLGEGPAFGASCVAPHIGVAHLAEILGSQASLSLAAGFWAWGEGRTLCVRVRSSVQDLIGGLGSVG